MSGARAATAERGAAGVDHDALLAALVLDPATYSRNRFFSLYKDPEIRRVRRRASMVRSVVRQLGARAEDASVSVRPRDDGGAELTYVLASVGLRRTVRLEGLEIALVRFLLGRAGTGSALGLSTDAASKARVESALAGLSPA